MRRRGRSKCPSGGFPVSRAVGPLCEVLPTAAGEPGGKRAGKAVSHPLRRGVGFLFPVSILHRVDGRCCVFLEASSGWNARETAKPCCPQDHSQRQSLLPLGHTLLNVNCPLSGCELVWSGNRTSVSVAPPTSFLLRNGVLGPGGVCGG